MIGNKRRAINLEIYQCHPTKQKLCFEADVSYETNAVKTMSAVAVILIVNCLVPSLEAKDIIRDKSPDGKFALRISKAEPGGTSAWEAAIIDLKSKADVAALEIYQTYTEQAHLVQSKDSQRVAYFEPDRRGGVPRFTFEKAQSSKKFRCRTVTFPRAKIS
jgi:hypothetical protein